VEACRCPGEQTHVLTASEPQSVEPPQAGKPVVHVLYRYTESVGSKPRPLYISKKLALQSFVQALDGVRHEIAVTFMVDGGVSADIA